MIGPQATRGVLYLLMTVTVAFALATFFVRNLAGEYSEWEVSTRIAFWREETQTWKASQDFDGWVEPFGEMEYNYTDARTKRVSLCGLGGCTFLGKSHIVEGNFKSLEIPRQEQVVVRAQAAVDYIRNHLTRDFFVNDSAQYDLQLARHEEFLRYGRARLGPFRGVAESASASNHSRNAVVYFALLSGFATFALWWFVTFNGHKELWLPLGVVAAVASFLAGMSLVAMTGSLKDMAFHINCDVTRWDHLLRMAEIEGKPPLHPTLAEQECHSADHYSWMFWSVWIMWAFHMLAVIVMLVERFAGGDGAGAGAGSDNDADADRFGKVRGVSASAGAHARMDSTADVRP